MSTTIKTIIGVIVVVVVIVIARAIMMKPNIPTTTTATDQTTTSSSGGSVSSNTIAASPTPSPTPANPLGSSINDSSDATLQSDLGSVDDQMKGLDADSASVDSSVTSSTQ